MSINLICEQSERGKATIMRLLAAAKNISNNTVPRKEISLTEEEKERHCD